MAKIIKDTKEYAKHVNATLKQASTLRDNIDIALRSAVYHVYVHGNINVLNNLIKGLDTVVHKHAHIRWTKKEAAGLVVWDTKAEAFRMADEKVRKTIVAEALEASLENAKPYYEQTKPDKFDAFNALKLLNAIVKKGENTKKRHDEGEITDEDFATCDFHGMEQIRRLIANLSAGTSEKVMDMSGTGTPDNGNDGSGSAHYIN